MIDLFKSYSVIQINRLLSVATGREDTFMDL